MYWKKLFSYPAVWLLTVVISLSTLSACAPKQEMYRAQFFDLFDTVTVVVGPGSSADEFKARAQQVKDDLEVYHELYDYYEHYEGVTNLYDVNQKAGQGPVKVDERIIDLLELSKKLYDLTNGKVNVAMGSVLSIWHRYRVQGTDFPDQAELPEKEELEKASRHCSIDDLLIDRENLTVELKDPEMLLDVGAIAKGYATEQAALLAEKRGEEHLLLSVGGNVRAIGARDSEGSPWRVGIENPFVEKREEQPNLGVLGLREHSLVTSGLYERFYIVDGKRYHHIIDPVTLFPEERFMQVSVYTKDSGEADGLSTALFNSSLEDGLRLIESLPDTEAVWVLPDGSLKKSSGLEALELETEEQG